MKFSKQFRLHASDQGSSLLFRIYIKILKISTAGIEPTTSGIQLATCQLQSHALPTELSRVTRKRKRLPTLIQEIKVARMPRRGIEPRTFSFRSLYKRDALPLSYQGFA